MSGRTKTFLVMLIAVIGTAFIISGCSKRVSTTKATEKAGPAEEVVKPVPTPKPEEVPPQEMAGKEMGPREVTPAPQMVTPAPQVKDVFFDFDKYVIRRDARETLMKDAKILKDGNYSQIVIEGHCDERGTSAYNLALGERRAKSTKNFLVKLGVDPSKITIISYGKERPFCTEHNEQCWQENRRAHFVLK